MLKIIINVDGLFLREDFEECLSENEFIAEAPQPPEGFASPKLVDGEWVEGGTPNPTPPQPTTDEKLTPMAEQLFITQSELEEVQGALDFLIVGGMY